LRESNGEPIALGVSGFDADKRGASFERHTIAARLAGWQLHALMFCAFVVSARFAGDRRL
jgi:hypothetical protein